MIEKMKLHFVLLQLVILYTESGDSIECFECSSVPTPMSCGDMTTCSEDESCFIEQVVTTSGNVEYNSGCESNTRCDALNGRRALTSPTLTKRNSDIVTCRECCDGGKCNNKGCGNPEFLQINNGVVNFRESGSMGSSKCVMYDNVILPPARGLYCYTCPYLTDPKECERVSVCSSTEKCLTRLRVDLIGLQPIQGEIYSSECEHESACATLKAYGRGACCDTDFCNNYYNQSWVANPLTKAPIQTQPTENPAITTTRAAATEAPGHHCDLSGGYTRVILENQEEFCVKIFGNAHKNWLDAKEACERDNARLVITNTREKINELERLIGSPTNLRYWIGLWDQYGNDKFYWLNGELLSADDWGIHPRQPTNVYQHKDEDCVYIYKADHWHDTWCSHQEGYVCERV